MKFIKPAWATAIGVAAMAPLQALAVDNPFNVAKNMANNTAANAGISNQRPITDIIGSIINVLLGFLGVVFLVLLLYAGFTWMTAGGDTEKVTKAKTMITQAVIGLVIITAAFTISTFVLGSLVNVSQQ